MRIFELVFSANNTIIQVVLMQCQSHEWFLRGPEEMLLDGGNRQNLKYFNYEP